MALTRATPDSARRGGSVTVIRLMPSGTAATDSPVTARPMISGARLRLSAQMNEPMMRNPAHTMSISRLPYRSPSRPAIGTAMAATSSVAVSSHSVLVVELPRLCAIWGSTGISSDPVSETIRPADRDHGQRGDLARLPVIPGGLGGRGRPCLVAHGCPDRRFLGHDAPLRPGA